MNSFKLNLVLADDDKDDCLFFHEALDEIPVATNLVTVNDGVQLMELLLKEENLPHVLYLDINMPRKNGFTCLNEIKSNEKLKRFPVIIFSTSYNPEIANQLQRQGAKYYIRKPAEFDSLRKVIHKSLKLIMEKPDRQNYGDTFLLTAE